MTGLLCVTLADLRQNDFVCFFKAAGSLGSLSMKRHTFQMNRTRPQRPHLWSVLLSCSGSTPAWDALTAWNLYSAKYTAAEHKKKKLLQQRVWNWNAHKREYSQAVKLLLQVAARATPILGTRITKKRHLSSWVIFSFTPLTCHDAWLSQTSHSPKTLGRSELIAPPIARVFPYLQDKVSLFLFLSLPLCHIFPSQSLRPLKRTTVRTFLSFATWVSF